MQQKADDVPHWYVMKSLTNLIAMEASILKAGLRCYLPKQQCLKQVRGNERLEMEPVVPPYIFIHATYEAVRQFKLAADRLSFIRVPGATTSHSTMQVSDKEMEDFIRVSTLRQEKTRIYSVGELELPRGQRVRICGGPLEGVEGTLVKMKGIRDKRLVVSIPGLMYATTPVEKTFIQLL